MSQFFSGRRPSASITAHTVLKKSHTQRTQNADKTSITNVNTISTHASQQSKDQPPMPLFTNKLLEKQVMALLNKLESKLPCYSGLTLSAVESDQILEQVVGGLVKLAVSSPDYVVWNLCLVLQRLQKSSLRVDGLPSEEVLDSQLYILKILAQALSARWPLPTTAIFTDNPASPKSSIPTTPAPSSPTSSVPVSPSRSHAQSHRDPSTRPSSSSLRSDGTSMSWFEPAALDDATVRFALSIMKSFLHGNGDGGMDPEMYQWHASEWEPALSMPAHTKKRRKNQRRADGENARKRSAREKEKERIARTPQRDQAASSIHGASSIDSFAYARGSAVDKEVALTVNISEGTEQDVGQSASTLGSAVQVGGHSRYTMYAHGYTRDEALHGSYFASVPVLVRRYAGRVVYNLSASNWAVVFAQIKAHLIVMAGRNHGDDSHHPPQFPVSAGDAHFPISSQSTLKWARKTSKQTLDIGDDRTSGGSDAEEEDKQDHVDLKLLSVCIMDRTRLMAVLQEFASVFREMPTAAQDTASLAIRAAIRNWIDNFPREFAELWIGHLGGPITHSSVASISSAGHISPSHHIAARWGGLADHGRKRRVLDGLPERIFDMLHESSKGYRQSTALYPTLAALICISPDRLDSAVEAVEGTVKVSKKNNFLTLIKNSLTTYTWASSAGSWGSTAAEQASFAYLELLRSAFLVPPLLTGEEECSLRSMCAGLALELKNFMVHPPAPRKPFYASEEPIDVNYHAYCIAAIFRFHPEEALKELIQVCLQPERSQAVKLSVVKALVLLVVEASKYSWQPSIESTFSIVTPRLRSIFMSCTSAQPEIIDGIEYPPSPFPACRSLVAAEKSGLADVIDETIRLLVQIETLFPLEPRFWLFGTTDGDHQRLMDLAKPILAPNRDKREQAATVMALGATFTSTLSMPPSAQCYAEGMRYLFITAPAGVVNMTWLLMNTGDDHELVRMGINTIHTLLTQLAEGSTYDQDNTWRFSSSIISMIPLIEFSLWCTLTSSQMDVSTTAQRCLRLLSIIERNPAIPQPSSLFAVDFARRCAVLEDLGDPQVVIIGRVAFQKRIRKHVSLITTPTPVHRMVLQELLLRFSRLTLRLDQSHSTHTPTNGKAITDDLHEWQNIMYFVAAGARYWLDDITSFPAYLKAVLPPRLQVNPKPVELVKGFMTEVTRLLCSQNVNIREAAKEALGDELNAKFIPGFFDHLNIEINRQLRIRQENNVQSTLVFIEQSLLVVKMILERMDGSTPIFENDLPDNCVSIGLFIGRLPFGDSNTLHLRARFCAAVDILLSKRQYFAIRRENEFRNRLLDILTDWIDQHHDGMSVQGTAMDTHLAVLRLFVLSAESSRIETLKAVQGSDSTQMVSGKLHRYLNILVKTYSVILGAQPTGTSDKDRKSTLSPNNAALVHELIVTGIANFLTNNNNEYCQKICLSRCYDKDVRLRVVFMKAFTRVLNVGAKFDQHATPTHTTIVSDTLCQLVRSSKVVAMSLVQICPSNEVETIVPVLMHVFDTRHALVTFLKTLIDQEIGATSSPSQLMRTNTICARMLSAFARKHGYVYLRTLLESLVTSMMQVPAGCSFELDPSKLPSNEDIEDNTRTVEMVMQAFLDVIVDSFPSIPPIIREVCHHISDVVSHVWPESKYPAVGAFLFLRFISPAIVSPETVGVNIIGPERATSIRRGLLLVAKIIQNLSNNVPFGKEVHLMVLNPFLEKNVRKVVKFLSDTHTMASNSLEEEDQTIDSGCDDTDLLILHRFFQTYTEKIRHVLLGSQEGQSTESGPVLDKGRDAWSTLRTVLADKGSAVEPLKLSREDTTQHAPYQQFMDRNRERNTDSLNEVFTSHPVDSGYIFILTFAKINIDVIDFELLLYLIIKAATESVIKKLHFDVILDFTSFTARSRLPNAWLRLAMDILPRDVQRRWRSTYILNTSILALSFLRNVLYTFSNLQVARSMRALCSLEELQKYLPQSSILMASSHPASLENVQLDVFHDVYQRVGNQPWASVVLYVGADCLRIVSAKAENVTDTLSSRTVEVVYLREVEDIYRCSDPRHITLRLSHPGISVTFSSANRETLLKCIQTAKQRSPAIKETPLFPASDTADTSVTLLAVGLLHACHDTESVRGAAYELLTADCKYLNYPPDAQIPWRGCFVPANYLAFVVTFSDRLSTFTPQKTLDFILDWSVGFSNASQSQKIVCLQYVSPWIRNLGPFVDPSDDLYDLSKMLDCIQFFVEITVQGDEIYPVLQRTIWLEIGKLGPVVADIVVERLIRVAIDNGPGSQRCELAADTLISLSTVHTRAKILTELRMVLAHACNKITRTLLETSEWKPLTVLCRLALVAGHSPRLATQNQLYAAEIAHLITMLFGTGSLSMRLSTYGMAVNLLQALHIAHADNEGVASQLRQLLDDLATKDYLKLFGLDRHYPSNEISILEPVSDQTSIKSLERITKFLVYAFDIGSCTVGLSNVWKARWTSLVSSTAFQPSLYGQFRAFTVLSNLLDFNVEEEAILQMLSVFRTNIPNWGQSDEADAALLRCLRKAVLGLGPGSRYPGLILWLAVSIIQSGHDPLYAEAIQLLQASVQTMERHGKFSDTTHMSPNIMVTTLMSARGSLWSAAMELDELSGLSFEADFGFALTATLWRGVKTKVDLAHLTDVLTCVLKLSVRAMNPGDEQHKVLDAFSMPLFLGLSPCLDKEKYERLLEEDCQIVDPFRDLPEGQDDNADDYRIDMDVLGISDMKTALLAVSSLLTMEDSYVVEAPAKENIHFLWAEVAKVYPDLFASGMWYLIEIAPSNWFSHKMDALFSYSASQAHLQAVSSCFDTIMSRGTPGASFFSLGLEVDPDEHSSISEDGQIKDDTFKEMLCEIGMGGLLDPFYRSHKTWQKADPKKRKRMADCVAGLVELICSQ